MTVTVQLNGTALIPQPRNATWSYATTGGKLDGTDALGSYRILQLEAPVTRGGTAAMNWQSFENSVLTSIQAMQPGETMNDGTETVYSSGVVSKPITQLRSEPGGILRGVEMTVQVVV